MVDAGRKLLTAPVDGWYDCGTPDALLATNRHLLEQGRARAPAPAACPGCTIRPPVYVEDGAVLRDAVVGPNVSIEAGTTVVESTVVNSIVGRNVRVLRATVADAVVGDDQVIEGREVRGGVLDGGELVRGR
jgi:glucose-1-phosphate thymidylyltransferase